MKKYYKVSEVSKETGYTVHHINYMIKYYNLKTHFSPKKLHVDDMEKLKGILVACKLSKETLVKLFVENHYGKVKTLTQELREKIRETDRMKRILKQIIEG